MERSVVVTGIGLVCAVGNTVPETWDNLLAGRSGIGAHHQLRYDGFLRHLRGRGEELRSAAVRRQEGIAQDGALHSSGAGSDDEAIKSAAPENRPRRTPTARECIIGSGIGGFEVIEREHSQPAQRRTAQDISVLHSGGHREHGSRACEHQVRRQGAESQPRRRPAPPARMRSAMPAASSSTAMPM